MEGLQLVELRRNIMIDKPKIQRFLWKIMRLSIFQSRGRRPFQGPYIVQKVFDNGVQLKKVDSPRDKPLRVTLNRVRKCPKVLVSEDNSGGTRLEPPITPWNKHLITKAVTPLKDWQ